MMKTLVIHPEDHTTRFLSVIYADKDWTIINDPRVSKKKLKEQIKSHDRIIMLGHGTEQGMGDMINGRFLIDSNLVYLLREKELVGIWCNADIFFEKYKLKGLYTGMIISEYEEAIMYCIYDAEDELIEESNIRFASAVAKYIDSEDDKIVENIKKDYCNDDCAVSVFNERNIYKS